MGEPDWQTKTALLKPKMGTESEKQTGNAAVQVEADSLRRLEGPNSMTAWKAYWVGLALTNGLIFG